MTPPDPKPSGGRGARVQACKLLCFAPRSVATVAQLAAISAKNWQRIRARAAPGFAMRPRASVLISKSCAKTSVSMAAIFAWASCNVSWSASVRTAERLAALNKLLKGCGPRFIDTSSCWHWSAVSFHRSRSRIWLRSCSCCCNWPSTQCKTSSCSCFSSRYRALPWPPALGLFDSVCHITVWTALSKPGPRSSRVSSAARAKPPSLSARVSGPADALGLLSCEAAGDAAGVCAPARFRRPCHEPLPPSEKEAAASFRPMACCLSWKSKDSTCSKCPNKSRKAGSSIFTSNPKDFSASWRSRFNAEAEAWDVYLAEAANSTSAS